jgi:hypothetical protein
MPTADQHRRKAEKNRRLIAALDLADHPEWAVTVAFYVALHRVEQLRHTAGDGHGRDHAERLDYLHFTHPAIYDPFRWLYKASRVARYEAASTFFADYDADVVRARVIAGWLAAVEGYVAVQTSPPEAAP